jgi:hypothetical protein
MRRYRARQRALGRPEASAVDIAVAAAVAAYSARAAEDPSLDVSVLKALLEDAVSRLEESGCKRREARRKLVSRIGRFSLTVPGQRSRSSQ